jgi:hypothetical protein
MLSPNTIVEGDNIQKRFTQGIGLRKAIRAGLGHIFKRDTPLAAVAQHALELFLILRRGDDCDLADVAEHQHRQRVIDHRLVIDRQQLFGHTHGDRVQPCARTTSQNDAFALCHGKSSLSKIQYRRL